MDGRRIGPYELLAELGSGGMGTVWRAAGPDGVVALKVVHRHVAEAPGFRDRFVREAEIGAAIRHANVVATLASGTDGGASWIALELVEGQTLRSLLADLGRVPEELCLRIARGVACGLAAVHAAGIVHRDVKPENVLITSGHTVKLMDLGIARAADDALRLTSTGTFVGSVQYAAPEQFTSGGRGLDGRADLHSLGATLFELATGLQPFADEDVPRTLRRVLEETPRKVSELNPQLSPFFEEIVRTLLAKDRERRFASAEDLVRVLDDGEAGQWWRDRVRSIRAETRRPLRRIRIPRESALHGRDAELAALAALYESAKAGEGRVVLVEGEAGIGKSRIVDEFVARLAAAGEDFNFLFGGYPPGGAATASGAFTTAYREQFGEEGAARHLADTPLLIAAFDAFVRGDAAPQGAEALTRDSIQTCFVYATRSLAAERPTVVLIDDLHFAPDEGRALFASLACGVAGHRVLLVGTYRPGIDPKWIADLGRAGVVRIAVPRLGPRELVTLLADSLRSDTLAEELAGKIALKSDGNPYFVFEILRGLRDGQFLTRRADGRWVTTRAIREIQVPSSVLDLVQARVADLDASDRNLLDVASCVGFEFEPGLAAEVLGLPPIAVIQRLARIENRSRLVRSAGRRFVFDHHQVQEALYGGMHEVLRESYHAGIAEALEARVRAAGRALSDADGALRVELARHFLLGGRGPQALVHLDAALTHLDRAAQYAAMVDLAERALTAPGLVAGSARIELLLRVAARLGVIGRADAERAAIDEALALAGTDAGPSVRSRALRASGWHLYRASRHAEAAAQLTESLELARAAGDAALEASSFGTLGLVDIARGRFDAAQRCFERCLEMARAAGDAAAEARSSVNLGLVFFSAGRFAEAQPWYERGIALSRGLRSRLFEGTAVGNLGNVLWSIGRTDEARACYERQLALAREIGHREGEARATGNLGGACAAAGRFADAHEFHERHLELAREVGDREGEGRAFGNLAVVELPLGRIADAGAHAEAYLALSRAIGYRRGEGYALGLLADVASEQGDEEAAQRHREASLAVRRASGDRAGEATALHAIGSALADAGRHAEARATLSQSLALARELHVASVEVGAGADLAALAAAEGAADAAELAASAAASLSAYEPAGDRRTVLHARFLLWRATRDRAHLAEASRILDSFVAHAPPDCRASMLRDYKAYRDVAEAARAEPA